MSHQLRASLRIIPTQSPQHFMMAQWFLQVLDINAFGCPYFDFGVVVFCPGDGNGLVDIVADCLCEDL
jgi:hypothetical protein